MESVPTINRFLASMAIDENHQVFAQIPGSSFEILLESNCYY
jgi:hypothetical protein